MNLVLNKLLVPVENDVAEEYIKTAAKKLGVDANDVTLIKILAKKLNFEDKHQFYYEMSVAVSVSGEYSNKENFPLYKEKAITCWKPKKINGRPIIIGFGPAGMFAALELIEHGIKPLIFERGRDIESRHKDVRRFIEERVLDEESNIQFGEGGAGSYSDGKLFSKKNNTYQVSKVLETFVKFGGPEEIKYVFKPHLGTDVLCGIVKNISEYIIERGGQIHYGSKMTGLQIDGGQLRGVVINGTKEYNSSIVYLAVGHSARDTFRLLYENGVCMEQKPISIGLRVEHPVGIINLSRYGNKYKDFVPIGAANYSFTYSDRVTGRAVNTFCMCPGGEVVNASSQRGLMAINGMSYSKRDSPYSNAALVVGCRLEDYGSADPLSGIEFQKSIEEKAYNTGGRDWKVPAQNLFDFLSCRVSKSILPNSCKLGVVSADINEILPKFITETLHSAFNTWREYHPLFVSEQAVVFAPETRTSCPVIIRRSEKYESVNIKNLYPIGEGSGHTGGITSSAADGIRAVERSLADVV